MIRFLCPGCGQKLKAAPQFAGRTIVCTGCQQRLEVPADPHAEMLAAPEVVEELPPQPTPPEPEPPAAPKKKKKRKPASFRSGRASDYETGRRQAWLVFGLLLALEAFNVGGLFVLEYAMKRRAQQLLDGKARLLDPRPPLLLHSASRFAHDEDDDPNDAVVFPMQPGRAGPKPAGRADREEGPVIEKIEIDLDDDEDEADATFQRLKSWISLAVRLTIAFFLTLGHEWARSTLVWIMGLSLGVDLLGSLFLIKLSAVLAPLAGTGVIVTMWGLIIGTMLIEAGILTFLLASYSLRVYCGSE